jgi:hypothetical protein
MLEGKTLVTWSDPFNLEGEFYIHTNCQKLNIVLQKLKVEIFC